MSKKISIGLSLAIISFITIAAEARPPRTPAQAPATKPATQPAISLLAVHQLIEKAAASDKALEKARAAALANSGVDQTAEYKQALADAETAQAALDNADDANVKMNAAADKAKARAHLQKITDVAISTDPSIEDIVISAAAAHEELREAITELNEVRATAARQRQAVAKTEKSPADAINAAISQHELVEGMTPEQCNGSIGRRGTRNYSDSSGMEMYEWDVLLGWDVTHMMHFRPYLCTFQDGKLVSWCVLGDERVPSPGDERVQSPY